MNYMLLLAVLTILFKSDFSKRQRLFNKYKHGINRTITRISGPHAQWLKANCGIRRPDIQIDTTYVSGIPARTHNFEFPWAVGLKIRTTIGKLIPPYNIRKSYALCSGSLISNKHIITAQHCFGGIREKWHRGEVEYIRGAHFGETEYKAKITIGQGNDWARLQHKTDEKARFIINEAYAGKFLKNDWALVELEHEVPQALLDKNKAVIPVCMPKPSDVISKGDFVEAYGENLAGTHQPVMRKDRGKIVKTFNDGVDRYGKTLATKLLKKIRLGDNGGGLTKIIRTRQTLVGVLAAVENPNKKGINKFSNIERSFAVDVTNFTYCIEKIAGIKSYEEDG